MPVSPWIMCRHHGHDVRNEQKDKLGKENKNPGLLWALAVAARWRCSPARPAAAVSRCWPRALLCRLMCLPVSLCLPPKLLTHVNLESASPVHAYLCRGCACVTVDVLYYSSVKGKAGRVLVTAVTAVTWLPSTEPAPWLVLRQRLWNE